MAADLSSLMQSAGMSDRAVHPADLERARALIDRGHEPLPALTRAAILNALDHGHASLDEIENTFGEDALHNVYGQPARSDVEDDPGEGGEDKGPGAAQSADPSGEHVPRAVKIEDGDGEAAEAAEAGEDEAGPGDVPIAGAAETDGATGVRPQSISDRLIALGDHLAAELREIAADLAAEEADEDQGVDITEKVEPAEEGSRAAPVVVENADDIARAGERVHPEPSEAQREAGNYTKGHLRFDGFDVTIETPKGGVRRGKNADGSEWQSTLPATYGYLKRTEGADSDNVDVYLSDNAQPGRVFVIDQLDPATRAFDEHKAILGARSRNEARAIYVSGFSDRSGPRRIGGITEMSTPEFKRWLEQGDMKRPLRGQRSPEAA